MLDTDAIARRLALIRTAREDHVSKMSDNAQLPRLPSANHALPSLIGGLLQTVYVETDATHASVRPRLKSDAKVASDPFSVTPLVALEMPDLTDLAAQLPFLRSYGDLRDERLPEILVQLGDITSFFGAIDQLDATHTPHTLMLLHAASGFASTITQRIKLAFDAPRPVAFSPRLQPIIATPSHATLPSGHATEAFLLAGLLTVLRGGSVTGSAADMEHRFRLASRVAINRTVAGVHYPIDSGAGAVLGMALAEHLCAVAGQSGAGQWTFAGPSWNNSDFHQGIVADLVERAVAKGAKPVARVNSDETRATDDLWTRLWQSAQAELLQDGE
jgi:membrane-associated phospholipid phosphatase